jgi:hypothetical protein
VDETWQAFKKQSMDIQGAS